MHRVQATALDPQAAAVRHFSASIRVDRLHEFAPKIAWCDRLNGEAMAHSDAALYFSGGPHFRAESSAHRANQIAVVGDIRLVARDDLAAQLGLPTKQRLDDLNLIAAAWRRWGRECAAHLTGDFAFLLWDPVARVLFAARDPMGVKPFFYDLHDKNFVAASSLLELLAFHPSPPGADEQAIAMYLSRPFEVGGFTSLRQRIKTLPAGHSLIVEAQSCVIHRYCKLEDATDVRFARQDEYAEALNAQLREAVKDAVSGNNDSRDRIGVHLSGGLDSSVIAMLAVQETTVKQAYCWQPMPAPGAESADQALVRLVANRAGLTLRAISPDADDLLATLAHDPLDHSVTSTLHLEAPVQLAAQCDGVNVMLSGWGGDECVTFRGHDPTATMRWLDLMRYLAQQTVANPRSASRVLRRRIAGLISHDRIRNASGADNYLTEEIRHRWPRTTVASELLHSARSQQIDLLSRGHLAERMSSWCWSGAQRGIEYRYPLLDIRLIRLVLGMPPEIYQSAEPSRQFARKVFARILPEQVVRYTDKSDTTRTEATHQAAKSVLRQLLPRLHNGPLDRARYVDIDRLATDIESSSNPAKDL